MCTLRNNAEISNEQLSKSYKETSNPKLTEKRKRKVRAEIKKINLFLRLFKRKDSNKQNKTKEKLSQNIPQNTVDHKKMRKIRHQRIEKEMKKFLETYNLPRLNHEET